MFPREAILAGIAIADTLTAGVQSNVTWEQYTGQTGNGDESYATPTLLLCVLDQTRKQRATSDGRLITVVATLTFPRGGVNINPKDKITLSDGTTGPLVLDAPDAVFDPITGKGFISTVLIGEVGDGA